MGAPPWGLTSRPRPRPLSIPFAGSWGLRPWFSGPVPSRETLSIPFAGSWGLRPTKPATQDGFAFIFQSRLPGVGGSATIQRDDKRAAPDFQSRLPGVGGSARQPSESHGTHCAFNPVCRELGAPPAEYNTAMSGLCSAFNPVCRELGAPPALGVMGGGRAYFQSRLPGVGGSASEALDYLGTLWLFQSRLPGVGGSAARIQGRGSRTLSIPFAGSWGLRLPSGSAARPAPRLSIPFAGSWGLRHLRAA